MAWLPAGEAWGGPSSLSHLSELVDEVDQLAEPPVGAVVKRQDQPGELGELVLLLRHRARLQGRRPFEDVAELVLEVGELCRLELAREPEDQIVADDPRGVID